MNQEMAARPIVQLAPKAEQPRDIVARWGQVVRTWLDDVMEAQVQPPMRCEIETLGIELLSLCLRQLGGKFALPQRAAHLRRMRAVERVKEAVAVAPADAWSIARLAAIANLSSFHLCHVFHELVGTSIYDYVLRERLAQALNAVLDSGDDITGIAFDTGFSSHSHFTARFRRFFGCTPTALRRRASARQIGQIRKITTARASVPA
jgi:AraC-like DNA-binding protein